MNTGIRICAWGHEEKFAHYRKATAFYGGTLCGVDAAESCDGLLLQGGGDVEPWRYGQENRMCRNLDPERDRVEWALVEMFAKRKKPILGICRGIQVLNVFFGGDLIQDVPGHEGNADGDGRHAVKTADCVLRKLYGGQMEVNSAHHQALGRLGEGLQAVQWAPDGVVEAVCHRQLPIIGVQWHPERLRIPEDGWRLMGDFLERCQKE